jgi:SPP1 gp7 family putative phage head morphogenesis protein
VASGDSFNEEAASESIAHRLALLRYEAGTTKALLKAYDAALRDIDREMVALRKRILSGESLDQRRLTRLVALGTDLEKRIRELGRILRLTLDERLTEAAEAEAAFQESLFKSIGASFTEAPEAAVIEAIRSPLGGNIWTDRLATDLFAEMNAIRRVLAVTQAKGSSMDDIAKALGEGTSIVETYRGRLVAIARTETQRVANTVALATYGENLDVLSGVQWLATLDSRTCLVCAPLHNRVYRYDESGRLPPSFRSPPLHPRCRCFVAPLTKSFEDIGVKVPKGMKDRLTDEPASSTTFDAWLRRQSRERQIEVFDSESRRDAWAGGRIPLDAFALGGRVLNLGELRARYPQAGV